MSKKQSLFYKCAECGEMVEHNPGPHWLDSGTSLMCPQCGGCTVVKLEKAPPIVKFYEDLQRDPSAARPYGEVRVELGLEK